jgi:DNA-binding MarR family transcriptional regulator
MQKMEDLGYVIRQTDMKDMRQVRIFLTEKGKERNRRISQSMYEINALARQGITDEEWETLTALMLRVCDNLREDKKKSEE